MLFFQYCERIFSPRIYPENMVVMGHTNASKIFTTHLNKIIQTYFIFYYGFINEWKKIT